MTPEEYIEIGKRRLELHSLVVSLGIANTHFYLAKKLDEAEKGEFQTELHKSLDFWDYTIRAHAQIAMVYLCRVFDAHGEDKRGRPHHLLKFVSEIFEKEKTNAKLSPDQKEQLGKDINFLQKENRKLKTQPDQKVTRLRTMRDNFYSHLNYDLAIGDFESFQKRQSVDVKVDLQEIQGLVDSGFSILERWAFYYGFKGEFPRLVERKDDYRFVLESLRLRLLQQKSMAAS